MKIKNVLLRDFNINKDVSAFQPNRDIEVKWQQDRECRNQGLTYASFIGNSKAEINNQLSKLSNQIVSERCRTLQNLPKYRIINTVRKRIY